MCYYDQFRMACGCYKWGNFRVHCNKEYRTGETCGMKLVNQTIPISAKCKMCEKIDVKERRIAGEHLRISRWQQEGGRMRASMEKAMKAIRDLEAEVNQLKHQ